jgi:uncharacterized protein
VVPSMTTKSLPAPCILEKRILTQMFLFSLSRPERLDAVVRVCAVSFCQYLHGSITVMMTKQGRSSGCVTLGPWSAQPPRTLAYQLAVYFVSVFAVTWGVGAVLLLQPRLLVERFGPVDVATPFYAIVFFLAVWVPSLAGFLLTYKYTGRDGLRELRARLFRWRVGPIGLAIVLGIPFFYFITDWLLFEVLAWPHGAPNYRHHLVGWAIAFFSGAILFDPGPLGEEVGWRGFAFPRMLSIMPFWKAELMLGTIWGVWHVPAFFIASTGQSTLHMGWFILGAVALSFLMGGAYVATRGSVLYAGFLVHYFANQLPDLDKNIEFEVLRFALLALCFIGLNEILKRRHGQEPLDAGGQRSSSPMPVEVHRPSPRRADG